MVAGGETLMLLPVSPPGDQLYVVAPLATSVIESPLQMVFESTAATEIVGEVTLMSTEAVFEQPPTDPVTV